MIAKNTVWLAEDRTTPVSDGDKKAKFLLVKVGQEIADATVAKYEGAAELIGGTKKAAPAEKEIETREPEVSHRDPKHRKH